MGLWKNLKKAAKNTKKAIVNTVKKTPHYWAAQKANQYIDSYTGKDTKDIAEDNQDIEQEQFERNFQNQLDQQNYEKELQQKIFDREDNSYQRKVNDLKAAGLSPILAAGGSGSGAGQAIKLTTPQQQPAKEDPSGSIAQMQFAQSIPMIIKTMADITKTVSQNDLIRAQTQKTDISRIHEQQSTVQEKGMYELKIQETVMNNEYLLSTLQARTMDTISKRQMQESKTELAGVDARFKIALEHYINDYNSNHWKEGKSIPNPYVMEYQMAQIVKAIREQDNKFYKQNMYMGYANNFIKAR